MQDKKQQLTYQIHAETRLTQFGDQKKRKVWRLGDTGTT